MVYIVFVETVSTVTGSFQLLQNGSYRTLYSYSSTTTTYNVVLNPGSYRINFTSSGVGSMTVWATGVANGDLSTGSILE